jgi:hypothetical protein
LEDPEEKIFLGFIVKVLTGNLFKYEQQGFNIKFNIISVTINKCNFVAINKCKTRYVLKLFILSNCEQSIHDQRQGQIVHLLAEGLSDDHTQDSHDDSTPASHCDCGPSADIAQTNPKLEITAARLPSKM